MYFKFNCERCGKSLKASRESVGRRGKCPYCHSSFTVPSPPAGPEAEAERELYDALQRMEQEPGKAGPEQPKAGGPKLPAHGTAEGTNVSTLWSGALGLAIAAGFYLIAVAPLYKFYFGQLFLSRGWVPFVEVFLMGWAVAILAMKSRKLARQRESMLFDLLPNELAEDITPDTLDKFTNHILSLPRDPGESFLINRVLRGLEHFRVRRSNPEVASILASQSEIDGAAVESSYTLLKVFIWAIPILGFIGTVIGISAAVGAFSGSLERAQDIAVLKQSLGNVTSGLATAFDTTLIALVMSLLVMFPTSSMQKAEEDLLNWVDEYCNENLLKRLDDGGRTATAAATDHREEIRKMIDEAMADHHAELQAWAKKLESIGSTITQQVTKGWSGLYEKLQKQHDQRMTQMAESVAVMADKQRAILQQIGTVQEQMSRVQDGQAQAFEKVGSGIERQTQAVEQHLSRIVEQMQQSLTELTERVAETEGQVAGTVRRSAESLDSCFSGLERGLNGLNSVLEQLGQKQVVIQAQQRPRRSWWPLRRKDGDNVNG